MRRGGASPLCYAKDVSDEMVKEYRKGQNDNLPREASPPIHKLSGRNGE